MLFDKRTRSFSQPPTSSLDSRLELDRPFDLFHPDRFRVLDQNNDLAITGHPDQIDQLPLLFSDIDLANFLLYSLLHSVLPRSYPIGDRSPDPNHPPPNRFMVSAAACLLPLKPKTASRPAGNILLKDEFDELWRRLPAPLPNFWQRFQELKQDHHWLPSGNGLVPAIFDRPGRCPIFFCTFN